AVIETLIKGKDDIGEDRIIKSMVGREITDRFPARNTKIGDIGFEVKNWSVDDPIVENRKIVKDASYYVRKGEVVGFSGLMGAGRTEFAMSIFGKSYGKNISGTIIKDGKEIHLNSVRQAIDNGIAYVTEDRKSAGLNLIDNIKRNITIASMVKISGHNVVDNNKETQVAEEYRKKLNIKSSSILQKAGNLSGGNQQKVVLSKWIFADPDVLILDEPTRGIDVGSKYEIYTIINHLADMGKCVVFISSELPEILGMSDRVYVMNEGKIVGELDRDKASQESVMKCIMLSNKEVK
ncbi:MAG: ATP-binding cassette domain-containing protein, partial [Clostridiaceae bacterium]